MGKISLFLTTVIAVLSFIFVSCNGDKSGDYKLVDIDVSSSFISQRDHEKGMAEALGSIWHFEKIGNHYKLTTDGDSDAIIFSPDGDSYSGHNGGFILTFSSSGAILKGKNGETKITWTL